MSEEAEIERLRAECAKRSDNDKTGIVMSEPTCKVCGGDEYAQQHVEHYGGTFEECPSGECHEFVAEG